jgi:bacterioferritin
MDKTRVVDKLNEILRHEWTGVAQYAQAGFVVTGLWREVFSKMFFDSAEESFGHARKIGDKIVALGGVPTIERNPVKQSTNLQELLNNGLDFETKAVKLYTEAIGLTEADRALTVYLEDILKDEQDGVDHLTKILRDYQASAEPKSSATKAG